LSHLAPLLLESVSHKVVETANKLDAFRAFVSLDGWLGFQDESVGQLNEVVLEKVVVLFEVGVDENLFDFFWGKDE
jgi:hypothetical protein